MTFKGLEKTNYFFKIILTKKELVAVATQFPCRQARVFLFLLHLAGLLVCPQHYLRKKDRVWHSFIEGSAQ